MNLKSLFPLFCFAFLCFGLARCASINKEAISTTQPKSVSKDSKEKRLRREVADYALQHVGVNYTYAGKNPEGFDCSGFIYFVMKKYGFSVPGSSRSQEKYGKHLSPDKARPGDLIFFRRTKKGDVFHVAIVYKNDKDGLQVIHSTSSRGVVLDNISTNNYWKTKIMTSRDIISG